MNERVKMVLERTEKTLCRHLEDLNDQVEQDGGRIKDHMVLDGFKDSVKTLRCIKELMDIMAAVKLLLPRWLQRQCLALSSSQFFLQGGLQRCGPPFRV